MVTVSVIIPTYNAARYLDRQLSILLEQSVPPEIVIVDSSSTDATVSIAKQYPVNLMIIPNEEFDHGGTRTLAGKQATGQFLVYLTQDALPTEKWTIERLVHPLVCDEGLAAAFGRQVAYPDATPFAKHLRSFNYPSQSYVRKLQDRERFGLRTAFFSNAFAAYRRNALENVGWFKTHMIWGEDTELCAKLLLRGFAIGYVAEAQVYHSHNYSIAEEFKRYFDMGIFHSSEPWLQETFGRPGREGLKYVWSEIAFLVGNELYGHVPLSVLRSMVKYAGYRLGAQHVNLPDYIKHRLSMRGRTGASHA
jgi:rhamnosyltransferase